MGKKLTTSGIIVLCIGIVFVLIGIIMFGSLFVSLSSGFGDPFGGDPFGPGFGRSGPNPANGFVGVLLIGFGSFLIKVGLGMTIAGQAGKVVNWYKGNVSSGGSDNQSCPDCGSFNKSHAKFCNACGKQLQ